MDSPKSTKKQEKDVQPTPPWWGSLQGSKILVFPQWQVCNQNPSDCHELPGEKPRQGATTNSWRAFLVLDFSSAGGGKGPWGEEDSGDDVGRARVSDGGR